VKPVVNANRKKKRITIPGRFVIKRNPPSPGIRERGEVGGEANTRVAVAMYLI